MNQALIEGVTVELTPVKVSAPALSRLAYAFERVIFFSLLALIPLVGQSNPGGKQRLNAPSFC
jgi:hypothetical protein